MLKREKVALERGCLRVNSNEEKQVIEQGHMVAIYSGYLGKKFLFTD